jgi:hypothetical protein
MAKTYFEYADRQPESQINWFKVGADITDRIKKEDDLREKRKAATEEQFRKDSQELANAPQGNSDIVNQWTLNYASDASEYLLQVNKLLKSGGIKPKDYNIINQNLRDNTSTLFTLSKEYQAEYEEKMQRAQPGGDGSASEAQIMGMIEGFANLKDTKAIINPMNGAVSVGKFVTGKDGTKVLGEGPDNYMTVNQLRNRIKQKIDKYKVDVDLAGEAKLLGDVVTEVVTKTGSSTETGFMTKITDPTKRVGLSQEGKQAVDAYIKTENDIVNSKLTNPYNTSSILFDYTNIDPKTNKPYQVVFDEKLANTSSHYVLYSMKGGMLQPDFETTANGREQKKTAEGFIRNKFRSMLEQKTELQPFQQPRPEQQQQWQYEAGQKKKQEADALSLWQQIYSGRDTGAKETAKQGLLGTPQALQQGLLDIDISDGKTIKLVYADPVKNRTIKMVDDTGKPVSGDQFAASGTELHGVTDRNKFSRFRNEQFATQGVQWGKVSKGRAGEAPLAKPAVKGYVSTQLTDDLFSSKSKASSQKLSSILADFTGFKVEDVGGTFGNDVRVTAPDGTTFIYNANTPSKATEAKAGLTNFISGKVSEDKAKELVRLGVITMPAQQGQTTVNYGDK